ncbi:MAG TPA: ABC transporter permease, partial [Chryseolinea sp.]|nr:ABC transporter permease [Chryseolinea sp.]
MLRSIKLAWRNLLNDRQFSILNIAGLSTGLACSLLIFLWVRDERSIDKFHAKENRLYQVIKTSNNADGTVDVHVTTPGTMAATMKTDLPEVDYSVSVVIEEEKGLIGAGDKMIKAEPRYAGRNFFNVFTYHLLDGNVASVLSDEQGVVLSDKLALSLFNSTSGIVGKTIIWKSEEGLNGIYKITGVFQSPPSNASDQFDVVFPYEHYYHVFRDKYGLDRWNSNNPSTYLVLKEGVDINVFNNKIKDYSRRKILAAEGAENLKWEGPMFLQKYSDRYLYNQYENGKIAGGRIAYVQLFTLIAIIILVIASINFMNLATAKATARIREAGIRKLVGAHRGSLISRYIAESTFMAFLALALAAAIVYALLPQFRQITGKDLHFIFDVQSIAAFIGITLATGVLSGSYPAIYLTSFRPAWVLNKSMLVSGGQSTFRKGLVVFQFTLSIVFIISVIVVYRQMKLVQEKNLGFEKNNIITFTTEGRVRDEMPAFLTELRKIPGVIHCSGMDGTLTGDHSGGGGVDWEGKTQGIEFDGFYVNMDWLETFAVPLVDGRTFRSTDSTGVLFNETALRMMGLKNPLGKRIVMWGKECHVI